MHDIGDLFAIIGCIIGGFFIILFAYWAWNIIAFIISTIKDISEEQEKRRRIREKKEEEQRARQEEETRYTERRIESEPERIRKDLVQDKMQNVIINCPPCRGQGGARSYPGNYKDWTDWEKGYNWDVPQPGPVSIKHDSDWSTCPYCSGNGIAVATFQYGVKIQCGECGGTGQVTEKFAARLDVGVERYERTVACRNCGGLGQTTHDIVTVRTLQLFRGKEHLELFLTNANRRFFYTNRPLNVPIRESIKNQLPGPRS